MFNAIRTATLITALLVTTTTAFAGTSKYGSSAPAASAQRHIVVSEKTRFVNVDDGETIKFHVNGKKFTWHFSTQYGETSFDLAQIAPAGVVTRKITVYVAPNPLYRN